MMSEPEQSPNLKLPLFSLPRIPKESPIMPTPPRKPLASIPFEWEEAPGKPKACVINQQNKLPKCLDLPPRLLTNDAKISSLPSPTTVLEGPYYGKSMSFRKIDSKEKITFRSCRWGNSIVDKENNDCGETKVKITRIKRRGSFSRSSDFFASIYEGFKHVVPWKRR